MRDGALIIGGSYLLLKLEGMSSNYVFAQVKVLGGLLENNLLPSVANFNPPRQKKHQSSREQTRKKTINTGLVSLASQQRRKDDSFRSRMSPISRSLLQFWKERQFYVVEIVVTDN